MTEAPFHAERPKAQCAGTFRICGVSAAGQAAGAVAFGVAGPPSESADAGYSDRIFPLGCEYPMKSTTYEFCNSRATGGCRCGS
jgi:hypothetical protein